MWLNELRQLINKILTKFSFDVTFLRNDRQVSINYNNSIHEKISNAIAVICICNSM